MSNKEFGLVLDLSWLETNESMFAILERFAIDFYRFVNNQHEIKLNDDKDKLCEFLKSNNIDFTCEVSRADEKDFWVSFELKADTYLDVTDRIELRAR